MSSCVLLFHVNVCFVACTHGTHTQPTASESNNFGLCLTWLRMTGFSIVTVLGTAKHVNESLLRHGTTTKSTVIMSRSHLAPLKQLQELVLLLFQLLRHSNNPNFMLRQAGDLCESARGRMDPKVMPTWLRPTKRSILYYYSHD